MAPTTMFSFNQTPPAHSLKRSKTYGKQIRPLSRGLDEFVEGQDFVFAQKNTSKRLHSPTKVKTVTSLPSRDVRDVAPTDTSLKPPSVSARKGRPQSASITTPTKITPTASKTSSDSTGRAKPALQEASIFDVPGSDDEAEHYQLLASKLKQGPTRITAVSSLTEFVGLKAKEGGSSTTDVRPKLAKSATEVSRPKTKDIDIFNLPSSDEEPQTSRPELKRKRPSMNRAATVTPISPPRVIASKTPTTRTPLPAKRPRLSASPSTTETPQPNTPVRTATSSAKSSARRTPQRTQTSPPKLMQSGRSAPAVSSTLLSQPVDTPVCDVSDAPIVYVEPPKRRFSSASDDSNTPIVPVISPDRTPGRTPSTTPRQEKLWGALLQDESESPPNIALPVHPLDSGVTTSAVPSTRRRLVDVLKSAAEPSSDITASDDLDEEESAQEESQSALTRVKQSTHTTESQNARSRITYASQRSFLVAPEDSLEDFSQSLVDFDNLTVPDLPGMPQNRSHTVPTQLTDDEEEDNSKAMQSLHELRAAGGSRRFEDEIPLADLEGTGKAATSRRRAALMEISSKLILDPEFLHRFQGSNIAGLVADRCKAEKDEIANSLLAVVVAFALHDGKSSASAIDIYKTGVLDSFSRLLEVRRSLTAIAKDRASNMSRATQQALVELQAHVCSSKIWPEREISVISPQILALIALEVVVRRLREAGNRDALLDKGMLGRLLQVLTDSCSERSGSSIAAKDNVAALRQTQQELTLSLIESFVVVEACNSDSSLWDFNNLTLLVTSLESIINNDSCTEKTQQLILRICISLANNNATVCDAFARPDLLGAITRIINDSFASIERLPLDEGLLLLDRLVLALGALINLAEWSDAVRLILLDKHTQGLDTMVKTFISSRASTEQADSMETSQINVAYGYLAILLGNLCLNKQVKDFVRERLPGRTLESLVAAIDEFVMHHQRTDQLGEGEGDGAWRAFTERLRAVADALKGGD